MQYEARLCPVFDGQTEWSEQAVQSLVGQTPKATGFGSDSVMIKAARIEDGWVVAILSDESWPSPWSAVTAVDAKTKRWWRYAVIRGEGIPAHLDGKWYDLEDMNSPLPGQRDDGAVAVVSFEATNQWEQRDDGAVAVVYRMWYRQG